MTISALSKDQWVSVVKNAVLAGVATFGVTLQTGGNLDAQALQVAAVAAFMAAIKLVEKSFTPVV